MHVKEIWWTKCGISRLFGKLCLLSGVILQEGRQRNGSERQPKRDRLNRMNIQAGLFDVQVEKVSKIPHIDTHSQFPLVDYNFPCLIKLEHGN
jgi:hypothetical protein